ncbi:MAG: hypothetical protein KatS3mg087_0307 [Patescibacteria group bacterium]|nr:MAG: hypothetical protein KatS3mg087_0307 [Patescibacteria group bacterium]
MVANQDANCGAEEPRRLAAQIFERLERFAGINITGGDENDDGDCTKQNIDRGNLGCEHFAAHNQNHQLDDIGDAMRNHQPRKLKANEHKQDK